MSDDLNRKRAEWAGFKLANVKEHYHYEQGKRVPDWLTPQGVSCDDYPQFDFNLDACFKWLVPEIPNLQGIQIWPTTTGYWWEIFTGEGANIKSWDRFEGSTLAEAIDQLVDKGVQSE